MAEFGNKFRLARTSKGVELDVIAQETRISARFLRAIEDEAFELLPGGVFNRGFIRTYAERVGLDPEEAIAEYRELVSEPSLEESELPQKAPLDSEERHIFPIAVGALIVLIVLFYVFAADTRNQTEAAVEDGLEVAVLNEPEPVLLETLEPAGASLPVTDSAMDSPVPDRVQTSPDSTPAGSDPLAASPVVESVPNVDPVAAPDVSNVPQVEAADRAPADPEAREATDADSNPISVRIDVHDDTWVAVHSDGKAVVEGIILAAGTTQRYSATEALEMTIGNAAGLTLSINGREVPNLGRAGQVRTFTITPNNASRFTGS